MIGGAKPTEHVRALRRGTGGNRFVEADANIIELLLCARDQLQEIETYALETGRHLDLAAVTIDTRRIKSGRISVEVTADLPAEPSGGSDA